MAKRRKIVFKKKNTLKEKENSKEKIF